MYTVQFKMTSKKAIVFCVLLLPCLALCATIPSPMVVEAPDGRIINGNTAEIGQFPYMVSLRYQNSHFCGGAIINANWVATVYNCVANRTPATVTVVVGANHLRNDGTNVAVVQINHHPDAIVE